MPDKRTRAMELLQRTRNRLEILADHIGHMQIGSADDMVRAQADPFDYESYRQFDFIAHQVDLSTEGLRQIREMGQAEILDVLEANMAYGSVRAFTDLHGHLFHAYDGIDPFLLWETVSRDCPMMMDALDATLSQLRPNAPQEDAAPAAQDPESLFDAMFEKAAERDD